MRQVQEVEPQAARRARQLEQLAGGVARLAQLRDLGARSDLGDRRMVGRPRERDQPASPLLEGQPGEQLAQVAPDAAVAELARIDPDAPLPVNDDGQRSSSRTT